MPFRCTLRPSDIVDNDKIRAWEARVQIYSSCERGVGPAPNLDDVTDNVLVLLKNEVSSFDYRVITFPSTQPLALHSSSQMECIANIFAPLNPTPPQPFSFLKY